MGYRLTKLHLEFFNFRIKFLNSFSTIVDKIKYYYTWENHPRLKKMIYKISGFLHKLVNNLIKNKENWKERISVGSGFFIPEDE